MEASMEVSRKRKYCKKGSKIDVIEIFALFTKMRYICTVYDFTKK